MLRKKPRIELLRVVKNKNHNWKQTIKFKAWFFGHDDAIMRFMTNSIIIHMHFFLYASSTISIFEEKSELIWMKLDFHRLLPAHPQALLQLTAQRRWETGKAPRTVYYRGDKVEKFLASTP